jgi:hypothetical protein
MEQCRKVETTHTLTVDFDNAGTHDDLFLWIRFIPFWDQTLLLNGRDENV